MSLLRKNALFYRTLNRTQAGDLFMSLIHTCQLCGTNSFDYLIALQRHAAELAAQPSNWTAVILQKSLGVRRGRGSDLTGGRKAPESDVPTRFNSISLEQKFCQT